MGQPAAKLGDEVIALDIHMVIVPTPVGVITVPMPSPFVGIITSNLSQNVNIMGCPAATDGSTADNMPPHLPMPPGVAFQKPPSNKATLFFGSPTVLINCKMAVRNGDKAITCNDPADVPQGTVIAVGTVMIG
jgi:uncharacterized Zn-binding protein involved in type VI secretion